MKPHYRLQRVPLNEIKISRICAGCHFANRDGGSGPDCTRKSLIKICNSEASDGMLIIKQVERRASSTS